LTICREWVLVNQNQTEAEAKCLKCKSWGCEFCNPERRKRLIAQVLSGNPTKFITLTVSPDVCESPEERHALLAHSWKVIVKRMRRRFPKREVEYFSVTEATERGEPHLHIVGRFPFVPQSTFSEWMSELANSPIVFIERVRGTRKLVNYLAKYIGKEPAKFGNAKRYFYSGKYMPEDDYQPSEPRIEGGQWSVFRDSMDAFLRLMTNNGFAIRQGGGDWLYCRLMGSSP